MSRWRGRKAHVRIRLHETFTPTSNSLHSQLVSTPDPRESSSVRTEEQDSPEVEGTRSHKTEADAGWGESKVSRDEGLESADGASESSAEFNWPRSTLARLDSPHLAQHLRKRRDSDVESDCFPLGGESSRSSRSDPVGWTTVDTRQDDQMGPLDGPWADYLDDMTQEDRGHEEWWASPPSQ
jgi:hypothetical protein